MYNIRTQIILRDIIFINCIFSLIAFYLFIFMTFQRVNIYVSTYYKQRSSGVFYVYTHNICVAFCATSAPAQRSVTATWCAPSCPQSLRMVSRDTHNRAFGKPVFPARGCSGTHAINTWSMGQPAVVDVCRRGRKRLDRFQVQFVSVWPYSEI